MMIFIAPHFDSLSSSSYCLDNFTSAFCWFAPGTSSDLSRTVEIQDDAACNTAAVLYVGNLQSGDVNIFDMPESIQGIEAIYNFLDSNARSRMFLVYLVNIFIFTFIYSYLFIVARFTSTLYIYIYLNVLQQKDWSRTSQSREMLG